MLTRFVASTGSPRDPIVADPTTIHDVRCVIRLKTSAGERELVIATELGGGIRVFDQRDRLAPRACTQLVFHEGGSRQVLEIEADELHIFDLHTLEMLPDAPGPNDALYLYGAMRGPYPAKVGTPVVAVDGQLTVTRSDLLAGLIDGVSSAFTYPADTHGSRCVHALLPGDDAAMLATGRGIVLALPLVPGWMLDCPVPNDLVAAQIIHDVLSALRADLEGGDALPPLPVPSRAALESQLVSAGWRIVGDEAIRPKGRGLIGSMLQGNERRPLPREATLDELVAEAKAVLARVPNTPTAEAVALRRRLDSALPPAPPPAMRRRPSAVPPPVPPPRTPAPRPRVETSSTDWMKDFVDQHLSPSRPPPQVSQPARVVSRKKAPSWMDDFDRSDTPGPADDDKPKRDWSDDFD